MAIKIFTYLEKKYQIKKINKKSPLCAGLGSNRKALTFSWRRPISYRNQSIDLLCKPVDWFLYDIGLRRERVKQLSNNLSEAALFENSEKFF